MLWVRTISALIFAPLFLLAIHFDQQITSYPLFGLCMVVSFFALWEYFHMAAKDFRSDRIVGMVLGLTLAIASMLGFINTQLWPLVIPVTGLVAITAVVFNPLPLEEGIKRSAVILFGSLYAGLFISYLFLLTKGSDGHFWAQTSLFAVWFCDTGAYFAGSTFGRKGKHPFAKNLSPKKSWEGFIGGILSATICGLLAHWIYQPNMPLWEAAAIASTAGIMGPIGDLAESLLKRSAGVKDAGKIIPGHGGVLDRFDAVIFVAPLFFVLQQILTK